MEASAREDVRRACLGLIRAHFTNPDISQAWLAEQLHISRRPLNRCFEGEAGTGELLARRRLAAMGVTRIGGGDFDTFTDPRFYSYRRDGARSGRFASVIWLGEAAAST